MDEKRFIELMENNNNKLAEMMDDKIQANNEVNNKVLAKMMDDKIQANNEVLAEMMDNKIQANNEVLAKMMDDKIQANNEVNNKVLAKMMDDKIQANNEVLAEMMDDKIQMNNQVNNAVLTEMMSDKIQENNTEILVQIGRTIRRIEKRIDKLEEKIIDNGFYFEEQYGKKIDIIFEKLQFNDQIKSQEDEELAKYKKHNDTLLISHEVRITNLEKAVN